MIAASKATGRPRFLWLLFLAVVFLHSRVVLPGKQQYCSPAARLELTMSQIPDLSGITIQDVPQCAVSGNSKETSLPLTVAAKLSCELDPGTNLVSSH